MSIPIDLAEEVETYLRVTDANRGNATQLAWARDRLETMLERHQREQREAGDLTAKVAELTEHADKYHRDFSDVVDAKMAAEAREASLGEAIESARLRLAYERPQDAEDILAQAMGDIEELPSMETVPGCPGFRQGDTADEVCVCGKAGFRHKITP